MAGICDVIRAKAVELLEAEPGGLHFVELKDRVIDALPGAKPNTVQGSLWDLAKKRPDAVYKAAVGLFRHVRYKDQPLPPEPVKPPSSRVVGRKKRATQFEARIKAFMELLQFDDVEGARDDFRIGGVQLDVVGGHESTLLIVDCTMKSELGPKSLREKIKAHRGIHLTVLKAMQHDPTYRKYRHVRLVVATKNIDVRSDDEQFGWNEEPRVSIWDEGLVAYYENLFKSVGRYSRYNLLGEMRIKPTSQSAISVPAFRAKFGSVSAYSFLIDPHDLLEVSYVARREVGRERYYQRIINGARVRSIATYIDQGNILPNNLIIAFGDKVKSKVKFWPSSGKDRVLSTSGAGTEYGLLEFPRDYRSCWIIDGQHRLYAFVETSKQVPMPVVAFENLPLERQCRVFLDINKNQKPVPADLVWDLTGDMRPEREDGIIANTVKALDEQGPLYRLIRIPSKGLATSSGQLKLAGLCISLQKMRLASPNTYSRTLNPYRRDTANDTVHVLVGSLRVYFEHVKRLLSDDWSKGAEGFCLQNGGISVLVRIFERITHRCVLEGKKMPADLDYAKYLAPLANYMASKFGTPKAMKDLRRSLASEAGKDEVARELIVAIKSETRDPLFGGDVESDAVRRIRNLEGRLKELINAVLQKKHGTYWMQDDNAVPKDVRKRALRHMEKHGESDVAQAYRQLNLGECRLLLDKHRSLFYPLFRAGDCGFGSDSQLDGALDLVNSYRTESVHDVGATHKDGDLVTLGVFLDKLERCIDAYLGPAKRQKPAPSTADEEE